MNVEKQYKNLTNFTFMLLDLEYTIRFKSSVLFIFNKNFRGVFVKLFKKGLLAAVLLTLVSCNYKISAMQDPSKNYCCLRLAPNAQIRKPLIEACREVYSKIYCIPSFQYDGSYNDLLRPIYESSRRSINMLPIYKQTGELCNNVSDYDFLGEFELQIRHAILASHQDKTAPFVYTTVGRDHLLRDAIIIVYLLDSGFKDITINLVDTHTNLDQLLKFKRTFYNVTDCWFLGAEPNSDLNRTTEGELTQFVRFIEIIKAVYSKNSDAKINYVLFPNIPSYTICIEAGLVNKADCLVDFKTTLCKEQTFIERDWRSFVHEYKDTLNKDGILGIIHNYCTHGAQLAPVDTDITSNPFIKEKQQQMPASYNGHTNTSLMFVGSNIL